MDRQLGDRVERELTTREWAVRLCVGAGLVGVGLLAGAAVAGLAIRVFLALAGFREW